MKIIFLGTGSFNSLKNFQTNYIIQHNGKNLLFDCGQDIRFSLKYSNLSYKDIDAVYITHQHADHSGGLETLAFSSYFDPHKSKIELFGETNLLVQLWTNTLSGGLSSLQDKIMSFDDYFNVTYVDSEKNTFFWEDIEFTIIKTTHIINKYYIVPSFGLLFTDPESGKTIFCTGDTQFNLKTLNDSYKKSDIIIHDCECLPFCSGVHSNFIELSSLPTKTKNKIICVHYQDTILSESETDTISEKWLNQSSINGLKFATRGLILNI
ncbi:MAG: MBL fold metallo-hydrolase [bacterium]